MTLVDIDETMTAEQNLTGSEIGGASESAPQTRPVFSYATQEGGLIRVYVLETDVSKMAVASLDDGYSEQAFSVSTIDNANVGHSLVYDAIERFQQIAPDQPNPFRQLAQDKKAMGELNDMLARIFYQGD